jgi:hypothetical protein
MLPTRLVYDQQRQTIYEYSIPPKTMEQWTLEGLSGQEQRERVIMIVFEAKIVRIKQ